MESGYSDRQAMPENLAGQVTLLFLYEAAEVIDLTTVAKLIAPAAQARLSPKATTPSGVRADSRPGALTADLLIEGYGHDIARCFAPSARA